MDPSEETIKLLSEHGLAYMWYLPVYQALTTGRTDAPPERLKDNAMTAWGAYLVTADPVFDTVHQLNLRLREEMVLAVANRLSTDILSR